MSSGNLTFIGKRLILFSNIFFLSCIIYLNPINFRAQHECAKINSIRAFDGILQYFSPPSFYPIHLRVNHLEKENPTETCKVVLVSQVNLYKHKNLSVGFLTSENNTLKIWILKPYDSLVI